MLKGNNASSDRYAQLAIVDSTGAIVQDGLRVTSAGAVQVLSDGASNNPAHLSLWAKDTSIAGGDVIGTLIGQGSDNAASPPLTGAKINFTADHAWDGGTANYQSSRIDFFTQDNSGSNTLTSPRMTISSAGAVSVTNGNMTVKKSTGVGNTTLKVENDNSGNAAVLELEGKRTSDNDSCQIQFSNSGEIISAIKAFRSGANDAGKLELFAPCGRS